MRRSLYFRLLHSKHRRPYRSWNAPEELIQLEKGDYFNPHLVYRWLVQELHRYIPEYRPPPVPETDVNILAIADMLSRLHTALKYINPPPTVYPAQPSYLQPSITYFMLSYPSMLTYETQLHFGYISSLTNLIMFNRRAVRAEAAALLHYYPHYCDDIETTCPDTQILVLSYNAASLGASVFTIDGGSWICLAVNENPALGANELLRQQNNTVYWDTVRSFLTKLIGNHPIDELVLLGTHARDTEFLNAVRDVFNDRDGGVHLRTKGGFAAADSAIEQDDVFAAARGAATLARDGMETNFESCLENPWCEKPKSRTEKLQAPKDTHEEL